MNSDNTIGILVIVIGRYSVFWKDFYKSCNKYFLPHLKKTYFVFTDSDNLKYSNNADVKIINKPKLGWPYDSLLRFDKFLEYEKELSKYDYLFFFNIDVLFMSLVLDEILPTEKNDGLMTGSHPLFYDKTCDEFTYDRNPNSTAYIPFGKGSHYATGAINGGKSSDFLQLCKTCSENVHTDMDNNVMALWHDESHLNKYLLDKNPLIMPINYLYPLWQDKNWLKTNPFKDDVKIAIRDKIKYGGHAYLRGDINIKYSFINKLFFRAMARFSPVKRDYFKNINRKLQKY